MAKQQRRQISPQDDTEQQADTVYKIVEVVGVDYLCNRRGRYQDLPSRLR